MSTSTLNMEDLNLLWEDWQLEQSLGLTLFDDPWKKVDAESTVIKSEPNDGSDLTTLLGDPTSDLSDPFGQPWMEDAGLADMLKGLVQDSTEVMVDMLAEASHNEVSKPAVFSQTSNTVLKEGEILRSLIEGDVDMPIQTPPSPEAQVAPTINLMPVESLETSNSEEEISPISLEDMDGIMHSPLSVEDVESFLSGSEPSSPASSLTSKDNSTCSELEAMLLDNSKTVNGKSKARATPYSRSGRKSKAKESDPDSLQMEFLSKKDKKKLQNKNAAIRYRMKKKAEAAISKSEEEELEAKNKDLKDKVDALAREIQYMKDLMSDVYKAKGIIKA